MFAGKCLSVCRLGITRMLLGGLGSILPTGVLASSPVYDDLPVLVCRLVVVESVAPLVGKGGLMDEQNFSRTLERWRIRGEAEVVLDEGFLLPVGAGMVAPSFDSRGGKPVKEGGFMPGLGLRLGAVRQDAQFTLEAEVSGWTPPGVSFKEAVTLAKVHNTAAAQQFSRSMGTLQECQQGPETSLRWQARLQEAVAIPATLTSRPTPLLQTVFILPVAARTAMVAQPGRPAKYTGGMLRAVEGRLPSAVFWRVISHVRPDFSRPHGPSVRQMDLFWPDDKWELFVQTMQQAGGIFSPPSAIQLGQDMLPKRIVGQAMAVEWSWGTPLPSDSFRVAVEGAAAPASDQAGLTAVSRVCESHQRRWILFARAVGEDTQILALRTEFVENAEPAIAPKAVAVVEPSPQTATGPSNPAGRAVGAGKNPLDLYEGEWTGSITGQASSRVRMVCNWNSARTQLMRDTSVTLDPARDAPVFSSMVMKFDELSGKYHSQIVAKDMETPSVAEGVYDAASRTFIWTAVNDLTGYTMVTKAVFPTEGVMEWTQRVTDRDGRLVTEGGGRNQRVRR